MQSMHRLNEDAGSAPSVRELAMSAAWHGGLTRALTTVDNCQVNVVYRGQWSHGFGPDFAQAMIQFGAGDLRTGDVEIHLRSSDWSRHGHHLDPRYNSVILHVVSRLDSPDTRRADGMIVPTVVLDIPDAMLFAIDQELPAIWDSLGHSVCAEDLAHRDPGRLVSAFNRLGDQRFSERATRFEGELTHAPLNTVMIHGLFDAFGYTQNREPMRALASAIDATGAWIRITHGAEDSRLTTTRAILFGLGGFIPFSPIDAHLAGLDMDQVCRIEGTWHAIAPTLAAHALPATSWTRARTRPANHPAARLASLANLLHATAGDPAATMLEALHSDSPLVSSIRQLTRNHASGAMIGEARAIAIAATVVLPLFMAHARHTENVDLEDTISRLWTDLPRSEWSRPARRALEQAVGDAPLRKLEERAIQGLLHLDRALCTPRRCFECPIAAEVIRDRQRQRTTGSVPV